MIRGTTPTHIFNVDFDTTTIKEVKISYYQEGEEILVKRTEDCTIQNGTIETNLSQEETFLFDNTKFANIQVRILTLGNDALASSIMSVSVKECLDDEVLV